MEQKTPVSKKPLKKTKTKAPVSKAQTINNSFDIQVLTNVRSISDFVKNDAYMYFPDKLDWRNRFCATVIECAEREDSLELVDFILEIRMGKTTFNEWQNRYPDIKEAVDFARLKIGSRKRKGALYRKYDKDVVFKDMHKYDPDWLEINKYHSDMRKAEEVKPTTFVIHTDKPEVVSKEEMENEIAQINGKAATKGSTEGNE